MITHIWHSYLPVGACLSACVRTHMLRGGCTGHMRVRARVQQYFGGLCRVGHWRCLQCDTPQPCRLSLPCSLLGLLLCSDLCTDTCTDMCADMCANMYRCLHGRVYKRVQRCCTHGSVHACACMCEHVYSILLVCDACPPHTHYMTGSAIVLGAAHYDNTQNSNVTDRTLRRCLDGVHCGATEAT